MPLFCRLHVFFQHAAAAQLVAACVWTLLAAPAWAEDSRDDDIFGGEETDEPAKTPAPKTAPAKSKPTRKAAKGKSTSKDKTPKADAGEAVPDGTDAAAESEEDSGAYGDSRMSGDAKENTALLSLDRTQIGGFFYNRTGVSWATGQDVGDLDLQNNTLFDAYFDTRVNDRVRAYVRGRVLYNPLADVATGASNPLFQQAAQPEARAVLNQMWLKWDIARTVYFTAGRQFIRWGATRFWNPLDILNANKYNPLLFFDDRVGTTMLKVHVPWEAEGWNFYALLLNDDAINARKLGAAARAEVVVGPAEVGLSAKIRKGEDSKAGIDWSAAIGDIDVTGEAAMAFPSGRDPEWQISAGASWSWAYRDDDNLTLGVEYFHNPQGVTAQTVIDSYKTAFVNQTALPGYVPLYTGKDYVGALAAVSSPGNWNDVFITAFALRNLTDSSMTWQVNFSTLALTDLTVELYVGGQAGTGEFRGYVPLLRRDPVIGPALNALGVELQAPTLRGGLNLRVNL
jgi:hypothetical protein